MNLQDIKHQIFHAKSNELLKDFPSECIDLVVTSPPYDDLRDYEGVVSWNFDIFKEIAKEVHRVVKLGGVVGSLEIKRSKDVSRLLVLNKRYIFKRLVLICMM